MAKAKRSARGRKPETGASPSPSAPKRVVVWSSPALGEVDRGAVEADLARAAPALPRIEWRPDLLAGSPSTAARIAASRVGDPKVREEYLPVTSQDVEFELAVDAVVSAISDGQLSVRLYDAQQLANDLLAAVSPRERKVTTLAVWVTRRMMVSYSLEDFRYHARYAVFGYPVIFSLLGLVHAPAASVEATFFARELGRRGWGPEQIAAEIDRQYPEERVALSDRPLVAHALASTILQAAAHLMGVGAFCTEPQCRLFNPHRRAELRRSLGGGALCKTHAALFARGEATT